MNRRLLTILLAAFVIAGLCAFLVYRIVGSRITASKPKPTTHVVSAASDIKLGSVLAPSDLSTVEIAGSAPKGAILKPADAIGRGVLSDIYQGEPILESRLAPKGSGGGLAATIPDGMRACAVKVDDVVGVAGFVTPGMRVDVLVSGNPPGAASTQGTMTKTILQNIAVLSAGTDIQKDAEGKPQQVQVVNLLVTPEQAETLSLASGQLEDTTGAAQPAGHEGNSSSRHSDGQSVCESGSSRRAGTAACGRSVSPRAAAHIRSRLSTDRRPA